MVQYFYFPHDSGYLPSHNTGHEATKFDLEAMYLKHWLEITILYIKLEAFMVTKCNRVFSGN